MITIGDFYRRNARHDPDGIAVIFGEQRVTHAELLARVQQASRRLAGLKLTHQDRFAILAKNSLEYIELYGAAESTGFVAIAINYRLAPDEMAYIVNDSAPKVLLFEEEFAPAVERFRDRIARDTIFVCIGRPPAWAHAYDGLPLADADTVPRANGHDIAYLIYTSGTSGRPKGAMLDQQGQLAFGRVVAEETALRATDVSFIVMPLYHVGAKCNQLAALYRGCTLLMMREYHPRQAAETLAREKATVAHLAPLMVNDLITLAGEEKFDHRSLRLVQYASGPMPVAQLRKAVALYGPIFMQLYGMTEAGTITCLYPHQHVLEGPERLVRRLASAGVPPPSAAIKVVDDTGRECGVGEPGEVVAHTPSLLRGYWNNSIATAESLGDGWLKTGDVGWCDEDGFLFIVDRKKEVIISGGENIYPREVEEALHFHPEVEDVAVIGVPDEKWGEAVKAFAVTIANRTVTEDELITFCKTKIASYKKPKSIEFVTALPRLANHKIDKKKLREPYWQGRSRGV
ncbi:class I adenylate-forming enzyme family protein [Pseudorhodoplanes sp.]|uniref:class I adenylate-forming enzyme family protein n=1 Tax=Pseudorhodoplanes sp. TaxID=1934341 RepID=UPI003D1409F1